MTCLVCRRRTINLQGNGKPLTYTESEGIFAGTPTGQEDLQADSTLKYQYTTIALPGSTHGMRSIKSREISFNYSANTSQRVRSNSCTTGSKQHTTRCILHWAILVCVPVFSQNFGIGFNAVKPVFFNIGLRYGL